MGISTWFSLVKFSHSIFALPFALMSAWIAAGGIPKPLTLLWIAFCAVSARTAAMAFNRWLDRDIDRLNPRTRSREIPSGVLKPKAVMTLVICSSLAFCAGAFALNPLAGRFSLPVLFVLLFYSAVKRFHWSAHAVLGLALGFAPLGAWVAVRGHLEGNLAPPLLLALAVWSWVFGFDLIYASQDADFDRGAKLHSIPAHFGVAKALWLSSLLHGVTVLVLFCFAWQAGLGWIFLTAVGIASGLLLWQHRIVSPGDLSRADVAFFTLNGWVGVGLFLGAVLDLALR